MRRFAEEALECLGLSMEVPRQVPPPPPPVPASWAPLPQATERADGELACSSQDLTMGQTERRIVEGHQELTRFDKQKVGYRWSSI